MANSDVMNAGEIAKAVASNAINPDESWFVAGETVEWLTKYAVIMTLGVGSYIGFKIPKLIDKFKGIKHKEE